MPDLAYAGRALGAVDARKPDIHVGAAEEILPLHRLGRRLPLVIEGRPHTHPRSEAQAAPAEKGRKLGPEVSAPQTAAQLPGKIHRRAVKAQMQGPDHVLLEDRIAQLRQFLDRRVVRAGEVRRILACEIKRCRVPPLHIEGIRINVGPGSEFELLLQPSIIEIVAHLIDVDAGRQVFGELFPVLQ